MNQALVTLAFALAVTRTGFADEAKGVTLAFVGDIMLDSLPGDAIANGVDPFQAFSSELSGVDAAIGNLECPVATSGTAFEKIYTFRAHPRVLPILSRHFAAVSLANNHSGDYGKAALLETFAGLDREHLPFFGAGPNLSARSTTTGASTVSRIVAMVPATNEPIAAVASAGPARPRLAMRLPSSAVAMEADSPGVFSRIVVVEPPNIAP